jgi:hypothetical protein
VQRSRFTHRVTALAVALAVAAAAPGLLPPPAGPAAAHARPAAPVPSQLPGPTRERVQDIADEAVVSTRVAAEPFVGRREVFEFLLDHPDFATHVTRALKLARYRIWRTPEGLYLDDGWGTRGRFETLHADARTRVMYARGAYEQRLLPDIRGEAVVVIEYTMAPAAQGRSVISTALTSYLKLDSRLLALAGKALGPVAEAKADKEASRLMRVFARTTRAIEEDPGRVLEALRQRPDVPPAALEQFRRLLSAR